MTEHGIHPDTECRSFYGGLGRYPYLGMFENWNFYDNRPKGWKIAPMEGMPYSNANRCSGQCSLPEECQICKQYICPSCRKVFPFENGGTESLDCDACWSDKEKKEDE